MSDRELAMEYLRAREIGLPGPRVWAENEIIQRLGFSADMFMSYSRDYRGVKFAEFVRRALAFNPDDPALVTRNVVVLDDNVPFVRPENPYRFVPPYDTRGLPCKMIIEGPLPIEPPDGWRVIFTYDPYGTLVCSAVHPRQIGGVT